jgi:peptide-methionine (R)-S-oxide reductase
MASMNRRTLLLSGSALALAAGLPLAGAALAEGQGPVPGSFEITRTDEEWKTLLGDDAFYVMRRQGTERPWTSALLDEHREGSFLCLGCDLPLFESSKKFDSGTGWPSFWQALPGVATMPDQVQPIYEEVHCSRCGSHMGHLFHDVPGQPINNRYCIDGIALKFVPKAA